MRPSSPDDENWEKLRTHWRRNTKRLEHVIDQIKDGRTKLSFDRLPRTSYERIINKLQGRGLISVPAANASRDLNDLFNRFRPRSRSVPDEVVGPLQVLDAQLDRELVEYAKVVAAEAAEDASEPIESPATTTNGARRGDGLPVQRANSARRNGSSENLPGHH